MPEDGLVNFSEGDLHRCTPALHRYAFKLSNNHADREDLVQDTLVRAIASQHLFVKGTNLRSWLLTICYNQSVSLSRYKAVRKNFNIPTLEGEQESVVDTSQQSDVDALVSEMRDKINNLAPEHKTILLLSRVEGFNYEQISDVLSIPVGTVRSRLWRAKCNLRLMLNL